MESILKEFSELRDELSENIPIKTVETSYRLNVDLEEAAKKETLCDIVNHSFIDNYIELTVSNPKTVPYSLSPQLIFYGAAFGVKSGIIIVDLSNFPSKKASIKDVEEPYKGIATKILERRGYIL